MALTKGRDGWRFQHLKLIMECESTFKLLHEVCNSYLAGDIPNSVAEILSGAKLITLEKTNFDVCPIAIENCIRRLVSKAACLQIKKSMAEYLSPHQYGVATPGGAEMMTHLIQICLQQHPDWVILKLDAKNAFNTVSRQVILTPVAEKFPQLFPLVSKCYLQPSLLTVKVGNYTSYVHSEEGVQQGDPLGSFLFSLALQPILLKANRDNSSALTPSYLDDTIILGPQSQVTATYASLKADLSEIGLQLREDKCEAFSFKTPREWTLPVSLRSDGCEVLGTPIGHDDFVKMICSHNVAKEELLLSRLLLLQDAQSSTLLLCYCGVPSILHLLRTVAPRLIKAAAIQHDKQILSCFEDIIGYKL